MFFSWRCSFCFNAAPAGLCSFSHQPGPEVEKKRRRKYKKIHIRHHVSSDERTPCPSSSHEIIRKKKVLIIAKIKSRLSFLLALSSTLFVCFCRMRSNVKPTTNDTFQLNGPHSYDHFPKWKSPFFTRFHKSLLIKFHGVESSGVELDGRKFRFYFTWVNDLLECAKLVKSYWTRSRAHYSIELMFHLWEHRESWKCF